MAFVGVYLDKAVSNPEAVKQLKRIPEVIECHYTTGHWSIFIKILSKDNESFNACFKHTNTKYHWSFEN